MHALYVNVSAAAVHALCEPQQKRSFGDEKQTQFRSSGRNVGTLKQQSGRALNRSGGTEVAQTSLPPTSTMRT